MGAADHCSGADAAFLVAALATALRRTSETPELGRAARTWGSRFSAPVEALSVLSALRDALTDPADVASHGLVVAPDALHQVFDQVSLEAVDAASANLRSAARHDPLTGCANRRALDEDLAHAVLAARRSSLDLAVAVVDLDGLKQINDTEGHAAGDAAIIALVETLRRSLRDADTLYRTGGDEFVVVAPFTDAAGGRALMRRAERMGGPAFSWGVASLAQGGDDVAAGVLDEAAANGAALLEAADADLYNRRRARRRAVVATIRRRRMTTAASVAASVVVTASMAGLAAALESGGKPAVTNALAVRHLHGPVDGPVPPHSGHWPIATVGDVGGSSNLAGASGRTGPETAANGGGGGEISLLGLLQTLVDPALLAGIPGAPSGPAPLPTAPSLPTVNLPVVTVSRGPVVVTVSSGGIAATAPAPAPTTTTSVGTSTPTPTPTPAPAPAPAPAPTTTTTKPAHGGGNDSGTAPGHAGGNNDGGQTSQTSPTSPKGGNGGSSGSGTIQAAAQTPTSSGPASGSNKGNGRGSGKDG